MNERPTGAVSFMFTDVESSTRLWEDAEADMDEALARHHRDVGRVSAERGGYVFSTAGDGFGIAFASPSAAVVAAVEIQRALHREGTLPLRVRMGIHTGECRERDGDYFGPTVNRAARIMDAAHGGQILLSAATAELVRRGRDAPKLLDLGEHQLRDVEEPEHLWQVAVPGLERDFPPVRSLDAFPHHLPRPRTSFVGRAREVEEVRKLVRDHRLVTLTGVGGTGKTRLAVEVAHRELPTFPDGAFFADLSPLADASGIVPTVAGAVGMSIDPGAVSADEQVTGYLSRKRALLVVDNCEHLVDAAAELCDRLLEGCADLHLLATSREPLEVEGEQIWAVPPLALPTEEETVSGAISLFEDRAAAARAGFELDVSNLEAVGAICEQLDGLPLAIEFAAAKVSYLSPEQIAERLQDRFRLLTGKRRRVPERQRTLEAALDWSFELLSDMERTLLARLSVFADSFTLEAAEEVCGGPEIDDVAEVLGSLVARSLVVPEDRNGETRYRLLETVKHYARQKLEEAGESEALRDRHRDHYVALVQSYGMDAILLNFQVANTLESQWEELQSAIAWSADGHRWDLVGLLAAAIGWFTWRSGHDESARWLAAALDSGQLERYLYARCALMLAVRCNAAGEAALVERWAHAALKVAPAEPDVGVAANLLLTWGRLWRDPQEADWLIGTARSLAERSGSAIYGVYTLSYQGWLELVSGQFEEALQTFAEVKARGTDSLAWLMATAARAVLLHILGRDEEAVSEARALPQEGAGLVGPGHRAVVLAAALAGCGRTDEARAELASVARRILDQRLARQLDDCLVGFAAIAWAEDDWERARELIEAVFGGRSGATVTLGLEYRRRILGLGPHLTQRELFAQVTDPSRLPHCRREGPRLLAEEIERASRVATPSGRGDG